MALFFAPEAITMFKKTTLLIAAALLATQVMAQDIRDFFKLVPESENMPLSVTQRASLLSGKKTNGSALDKLDVKNGYLRVHLGEGFLEMAYWNMDDKQSQLIASNLRQCGPVCQDALQFYHYRQGKLTPVESKKILQLPDIAEFFTISPKTTSVQRQHIAEISVLCDLPRQGKNLVCYPENTMIEELALPPHKKITLSWNGHGFSKP